MILSLPVIKNQLNDFSPAMDCKNQRIEVTGLRLYAPGMEMESHVVYLGASDLFFHDGRRTLVCMNQGDTIRLQTEDLVSVANRIQETFSRYARWYNQCVERIGSGCRLSELLDLMTAVLPNPMIVVNASQRLIALSSLAIEHEGGEWHQAMESGAVTDERLRRFNRARKDNLSRQDVIMVSEDFFFMKSYCKHIFLNGERKATFVLKAPTRDCDSGELHLLEICAALTAKWIQCRGEERGDFHLTSPLARILDGEAQYRAALGRHLSLFDWEPDCKKEMIVISPLSRQFCGDDLIRRLTNESLGSYAINYEGNIALLCNTELWGQESLVETLTAILEQNRCCGAMSFLFTDMGLLYQSFHQAKTALEHSPKEPGRLYRCNDAALRNTMEYVNDLAPSLYLHPGLALLKAYDRQNKTEFYTTLFSYLRNERHQQAAAAELFIHRNTLFQRLQKIQELWPLDLNDPDERFYLLFSCYKERYAGASLPKNNSLEKK